MKTPKSLTYLITFSVMLMLLCANAFAQLGISPAQKEKLRDLMETARRDSMASRIKLMEKHRQLSRIYAEYNLNIPAAKALNREINEIQLRLLNINLDSQIGIRRILNRDQFEKFGKMMHHPKPRRGLGGVIEDGRHFNINPKELDPLGLTDPQRQSLKRLWNKKGDSPLAAGRKIREKSEELEALYGGYDLDSRRASSLIREVNAAQMELLESRLQLQADLRQILTEDQFNQMKESFAEKMKNSFGKPGGNRPWNRNRDLSKKDSPSR